MRALGLLALAVSCTGPATGPEYRGAPLAVVNGRMTAERTLTLLGDVRLALVWFTSGEPGSAAPDAVKTESVIYEPVFPAGFSVGLYDLPNVGSGTFAGPGGTLASAFGALIAYDDRNRNGVLDTYHAGAQPIDRVLGSSFGKLGPVPDPSGAFIAYVEQPGGGFQRGFTLVRMTGEVVGFDQLVSVHLDSAVELNLFICDELFSSGRRDACLEGLVPVIDSGVPDAGTAATTLRISGSVGLSNGMRNANLNVTVDGANRPDAGLVMNGVALVYDAPSGMFQLPAAAPTSSVVIGGENLVQVTATGTSPLSLGFFMPGNFSVTAPGFSATLPSNMPFTVSWTDSQDAGSYAVTVYRSSPFGQIFQQRDLVTSPFTVPGIAYQGSATLTVEASVPFRTGTNSSFIVPYVNQSIPVTLQ